MARARAARAPRLARPRGRPGSREGAQLGEQTRRGGCGLCLSPGCSAFIALHVPRLGSHELLAKVAQCALYLGPCSPGPGLNAWSTRWGARVPGCACSEWTYDSVGHGRQPGMLEPANLGNRSGGCSVYWVTALLPLSLALFPETGEIGGAWTCTGRGVFTLFVGRQMRTHARGLGAWVWVWQCSKCDYDMCPGA